MIGEGMYQFAVVATIVVGSILQDWIRFLDSMGCIFAVQLAIPLIVVGVVVFREKLLPNYTKIIQENLGNVIDDITKPLAPRPQSTRSVRTRRARNSDDMYDTESFEELSCSDDISTLDFSSDSRSVIDWSSRERRMEIARYTPEEIMLKSINHPRILIGWKISMNNGNDVGLITSTIKRKFAATKFSIEMNDGSVEHMKLQRGEKKGNVPFVLLEKIF